MRRQTSRRRPQGPDRVVHAEQLVLSQGAEVGRAWATRKPPVITSASPRMMIEVASVPIRVFNPADGGDCPIAAPKATPANTPARHPMSGLVAFAAYTETMPATAKIAAADKIKSSSDDYERAAACHDCQGRRLVEQIQQVALGEERRTPDTERHEQYGENSPRSRSCAATVGAEVRTESPLRAGAPIAHLSNSCRSLSCRRAECCCHHGVIGHRVTIEFVSTRPWRIT